MKTSSKGKPSGGSLGFGKLAFLKNKRPTAASTPRPLGSPQSTSPVLRPTPDGLAPSVTMCRSHSAAELPTADQPDELPDELPGTPNTLSPLLTGRHAKRLSMASSDGPGKPFSARTARKNSLPPVTSLLGNRHLSRPYMTLAEFKRTDEFPRQQRALLGALEKQEIRLREDGIVKNLDKTILRGKRDRKLKSMDNVTMSIPFARRQSASSNALKFFGIKKGKKRTAGVLLNNLILAIHDHKVSDALAILTQLSTSSLRKKKASESNKAFLLALTNRLEDVTLAMFERGVPADVNAPIFIKQPKSGEKDGSIPGFRFPSYFLLALAIGMHDLVKAMCKRANMNQSWFGLTPLIIAVAKASSPTGIPLNVVKMLLEHGANPAQGLPLEQFRMLLLFKAKPSLRRTRSANSLVYGPWTLHDGSQAKNALSEEKVIAARGKWVSPLDIAAASENLDIIKVLLARMEPAAIAKSSLCLHVQQDVMLTLEMVHAGADVNQRDTHGNTPLHRAARSGHEEMVMVLVKLNADYNARGEDDRTPLQLALMFRRRSICKLLVSSGADPHVVLTENDSLRSVAMEFGLTSR